MRVNIARQFDLTHDDGTVERFRPGSYDLPDELANHWYVKAHVEDEGDRVRERDMNRRATDREMVSEEMAEGRAEGANRSPYPSRTRAGTADWEMARQHGDSADADEEVSIRAELAQAEAEIRDRHRQQRARRPGERARLDDDAREEARRGAQSVRAGDPKRDSRGQASRAGQQEGEGGEADQGAAQGRREGDSEDPVDLEAREQDARTKARQSDGNTNGSNSTTERMTGGSRR